MGMGAREKATVRDLRRMFGTAGSGLIDVIDERSRRSAAILRRGFWGRLAWLLFGR